MISFEDAACRHLDPATFHPNASDRHAIDLARRVCARCPIRFDCLALALATPKSRGIWGGLTERERTTNRRQQLRRDVDVA